MSNAHRRFWQFGKLEPADHTVNSIIPLFSQPDSHFVATWSTATIHIRTQREWTMTGSLLIPACTERLKKSRGCHHIAEQEHLQKAANDRTRNTIDSGP